MTHDRSTEGVLLEPHVRRRWSAAAEERALDILAESGVADVIAPVVYGLTDASSGAIRYVGACEHGLGHRLTRHLYFAECGKSWRVSKWLREVDYRIGLVVLATAPADLRSTELDWIHDLREGGFSLTNYVGGPTTDAQKKAATEGNHRRFSDPAARARVGEWSHSREVSAETRAKLSAAMTGKRHTEESKAKMSAARKGVPKSEETKARMRAAQARRWGRGGGL